MSSSTFTATSPQQPTLFGRGGYNGPNEDEEDKSRLAFGEDRRDGYNKTARGADDDDSGRGGYN